jgi:hypothetical protein
MLFYFIKNVSCYFHWVITSHIRKQKFSKSW